jgi:MoxR-like ATPase
MADPQFSSPEEVSTAMRGDGYLAGPGLAAAVYLAVALERPLLLEGEAGVGKTEVARALARVSGAPLIRLQCYEGIDVAQALYEWDHARQLLHLRTAEATGELTGAGSGAVEADLYSERFLVRRPLLEALSSPPGVRPVLLIDEIDRADDEFEAFLLEVLSDYAVTIPELGTISAEVVPIVVLTSNRTRDVHDALKRRCLYHWVDHPSFEREVEIVLTRAPEADPETARVLAGLVAHFRTLGLYKPPGVAETIDWAAAVSLLGGDLSATSVRATLGSVLKYREDVARVEQVDLDSALATARDAG